MSDVLMRTVNLCKFFFKKGGLSSRNQSIIKAIETVDLEVMRGETLALVGESGSGKTTLGKTLIRVYAPTSGEVFYENDDISSATGNVLKPFRRYMQMVFQDPTSALNPRKTVMDIVSLPLKVYESLPRSKRKAKVVELLEMVDLPSDFLYRYPHSLSGGQKQRVGIARALASKPKIIVLDEPTSALDVSVQAKIILLLKGLRSQLNLTYVYISHDLSVVKNIADRIVVMYLGKIMEYASTDCLFRTPSHPYTKSLLSAIPIISEEEREFLPEEITLHGEIPSPGSMIIGCRFASRCKEKVPVCQTVEPLLTKVGENQYVRCHLHE